MRTRHVRSAGVLLPCALVFGACDPDNQSDPTAPAAETRASARSSGAGHASGSAFILLDGTPERITFSAVLHRDGHASGQFEVFSQQEGGIRVHGVVTCLGIEGNQARIGGTVTRSSPPGFESAAIWSVRDNGEGPDATDETTDIGVFFPPEAVEDWCSGELVGFEPPFFPTTKGEIQVHP